MLGAQTEWETLMNRPFLRLPDNSYANLQSPPVSSLWSDQLIKMLMNPPGKISPRMQELKDATHQEPKPLMQSEVKQNPESITPNVLREGENHRQSVGQPSITNPSVLLQSKPMSPNKLGNETFSGACSELSKVENLLPTDQLSQYQSERQCSEEKMPMKSMNPHNPTNDFAVMNQNNNSLPLQTSQWITQSRFDPLQTPVESSTVNTGLLQYPSQVDFNSFPPMCPPTESFRAPGSLSMIKKPDQSFTSSDTVYPVQEFWDPQFDIGKCVTQPNLPVLLPQQNMSNVQFNSCGLKDLSDECHNQSDIYNCLNLDGCNSGSTIIDPSVSSTMLDDFCTIKGADFQNPSDYLVGNFCSNQDVQSQITSASLADSQTFSIQEYADNSGGASSSNVEFDDSNLLLHSSWQQVTPRFRTYTKVPLSVINFISNYMSTNYARKKSRTNNMNTLKLTMPGI